MNVWKYCGLGKRPDYKGTSSCSSFPKHNQRESVHDIFTVSILIYLNLYFIREAVFINFFYIKHVDYECGYLETSRIRSPAEAYSRYKTKKTEQIMILPRINHYCYKPSEIHRSSIHLLKQSLIPSDWETLPRTV